MEGSIPPGPHLLGVRGAEKFGHNFSMHVSQPVMAALVAESQVAVVDPETVQQRRIQVVDVDRLLTNKGKQRGHPHLLIGLSESRFVSAALHTTNPLHRGR